MRLGKTNLEVSKNGFGALPIQRCDMETSVEILRKAYDNGIDFYDTAHFYTDSEEKIGNAFEDIDRESFYLASKSGAETVDEFWSDLKTSLERMKTDYLDLYQFHNISFVPKADDDLYKAMLEAKEKGMIRHIGITTHKITFAHEAIESGLYETLQYPFSYLSGEEEIELVEKCRQLDVGFIAMKAMGGGLISNSKASFAFLNQFENVLPIWGIQKISELDEFLSYDENTTLDDELKKAIEQDKNELGENFCRGCGYCMPCPVGIEINNCARMSLMLRRAPSQAWLTPHWQEEMKKIEDCLNCGQCKEHCPYELDTPQLLKKNYEDYLTFISA